jgi:hypothetical protein
MTPETDDKILLCLGEIKGSVTQIAGHQARQTYALIGVIAAMVGVKVLGTDPFLDIATYLGIFGCIMLLGFLIMGIRILNRVNDARSLTSTGLWFVIAIFLIMMTQIGAYIRDLGFLEPRHIYVVRIALNLSLVIFAWKLMHHAEIFRAKKESNGGSACGKEG